MNPRIARLLLTLCLLLPAGQHAHGWVTFGEKWPNGNVVMNLQLGNGSVTLIDGNTSWAAVAQAAMALWNINIDKVQFTYNSTSHSIVNTDGRNTMYWNSTVFGKSFGSSTLAIASRRWTGTTMIEGDITFNNTKSWNSYRGPWRYLSSGQPLADFYRVALHELGHVLGLDHPDDAGQSVTAKMNSTEGNLDTLAYDDIAGAQFLYGKSPWLHSLSYGWIYNTGNGWYGSGELGSLWFSDSYWSWCSYLQGWLWGNGVNSQLWSVQYRWLYSSGDGDGWYNSSTLGWLAVGNYNGAVWTSRFGWVWPKGDGTFFYSNSYGWLAANGSGGVWSYSFGVWL